MNKYLLSLILLIVSFVSFGQDDEVVFYGKLNDFETGGKLSDITIEIYADGQKVKTVKSDASGKFEILMDYDKYYEIKFGGDDLVQKTIAFDTRDIPEEEKEKGNFQLGPAPIDMFENIPGIDWSPLDQPIAVLAYSAEINDLDYDYEYTESVKDELEKIVKEYLDAKANADKLKAQQQKQFDALVKEGDKASAKEDYQTALNKYHEALKIFEDDDDVLMKIIDLEQLMADQAEELAAKAEAEKQKKYNDKMEEAEAAVSKEDFQGAIALFQEAKTILPDEEKPNRRIEAVNQLLKDQQEKLKVYNETMAAADEAMKNEDYSSAILKYMQVVSTIKPGDEQAKLKLEEAEKLKKEADEYAELKVQYDKLIAQADEKFNASLYEEAITLYEEAQKILSKETYPAEKIEESNKLLANQKAEAEKEAEFQKFMDAGQQSIEMQQFENAISNYEQALSIKDDQTAKDQIAFAKSEIERIKKEQEDLAAQQQAAKELEEKYSSLISEADALFKSEDYENSITKYTEALALDGKSGEEHPTTQIALANEAIEKLKAEEAEKLANEAKEKEIQEAYQAAITEGDNLFNTQDYTNAISQYEKALSIIEGDKYATKQIEAANDAIAQLEKDELAKKEAEEARLLALQKEYDNLLAQADKAFNGGKFEESISFYQQANRVEGKENEDYPKNRITEAQNKIADLKGAEEAKLAEEQRQKEIDEKYQVAIAKAQEAKSNQELELAISSFKDAQAIKPSEELPAKEIAKLVALLLAKEQNDAEAEKARLEKEAAEKLAAEKLAAQKALDEKYNAIIKQADENFDAENYKESISLYNEAIAVKNESYPNTQIKEAEKRIQALIDNQAKAEEDAMKEQERQMKKYRDLVSKADKLFDNTDYAAAIVAYENALSFQPDNSYPSKQIEIAKSRLKEIQDQQNAAQAKLDKQKALDKQYQDLIDAAQNKVKINAYQQAIVDLRKASSLKPSEQFPKDEITRLNKIIFDLKAKEEAENAKVLAEKKASEKAAKYAALMQKGTEAKINKEYQEAISIFQKAKLVDPNATQPQKEIDEINLLIERDNASLLAKQEAERKKKQQEEELRLQREKEEADRLAAEMARREKKKKFENSATIDPDEAEDYFANQKDEFRRTRITQLNNQVDEQNEKTNDLASQDNEFRLQQTREVYKSNDIRIEHSIETKDQYYEQAKDFNQYKEQIYEANDEVNKLDNEFIEQNNKDIIAQREERGEINTELNKVNEEAVIAIASIKNKQQQNKDLINSDDQIKRSMSAEKLATIEKEQGVIVKENEAELYNRAIKIEETTNEYTRNKKNLSKTDSEYRLEQSEDLEKYETVQKEYDSDAQNYNKELNQETKEFINDNNQQKTSYDLKDEKNIRNNQKDLNQLAIKQAEELKEGDKYNRKVADESEVNSKNIKKQNANYSETSKTTIQSNTNQMNEEQRNHSEAKNELDAIDKKSRESAVNKLNDLRFASPTYDTGYKSLLAEEFPEGVTEKTTQVKDDDGKITQVIVRRIVVNGNHGDDYQKVMSMHGTFYFKNGEGISKNIWDLETTVNQSE